MKNIINLSFLLYLAFLTSCGNEKAQKEITIQNPLDIVRIAETISVPVQQLAALTEHYALEDLLVKDDATGGFLVRQLIDNDLDGTADELLFQVDIQANEEKHYTIAGAENGAALQPESEFTTYSRFVPERTDDYTWENDRVAFRTYGPEAQRMIEANEPGGTLSSGIDLWLKRVSYSIIDDWYAKNLDSVGYYHIDHGEGYDPYHVGKSRGTGGIGVWLNDSLYTSRNFTAYRTIATGPIRTVFELDYAPWSEFGIKETKRISLDLGSNFSKFEITLEPAQPVPNFTVGLTLHERAGESRLNSGEGWCRYWEPIDDSFVGEGIVFDPASVDTAFTHLSEAPDQSQILIVAKPADVLAYYAGFAWLKSGQVTSAQDWDAMLQQQAQRIANPLQVSFK